MSEVMQVTHVDLTAGDLLDKALQRSEGTLSAKGVLTVHTGKRTGRSPKDRFIVQDKQTQSSVDWGSVNQPIKPAVFERLWAKTEAYLDEQGETFVSHLRVGADPSYFLPVKVRTEWAWHNLFARNMFINPEADYAEGKDSWQILSAPGLITDPKVDGTHGDGTVMIDLYQRRVLLCGMRYAGEMKKAMFTVLNYWLTAADVLPMHCAANVGESGDVALFFGLSGTGKTTLSADPSRFLIGDDEHGWSREGVSNFEGGCYAKCIHLSPEREPVIWNAIRRGAIMENVVLRDNGEPDFSDDTLTQNSRAAYPREHIPECVPENRAGVPESVVFLTCDLFGVLPPVALLNKEQAAYYFLSGYTALVGSTEVGSASEITSTFSTCFGAPFFPRPSKVYADLLIKRIEQSGCQVYLVNTGWTGGAFGQGGKRFEISTTRTVVRAAISGELLKGEQDVFQGFNFLIPRKILGVSSTVLNPRNTWVNQKDFDIQKNSLIAKFKENFKRFTVPSSIIAAGPEQG